MSKGIFIVDEIPKCCGSCRYANRSSGFEYICTCALSFNEHGTHKRISRMADKPDWCPVIPMGKDLEEKLEHIDRFFNSISTEELERVVEEEMADKAEN